MNAQQDMAALCGLIDTLAATRTSARLRGDYATADALRDRLLAIRVGMYTVALDDEREGGTWHWTVRE